MLRPDLTRDDLLPMAAMELGDGDYMLVIPGAVAETATELLVQLQPIALAVCCPQ